MKTEIIIAIIGVATSILTFYVGLHIGKRNRIEDSKENRINNVVNKYMQIRRNNYSSHLHGLLISGVAILQDDNEILEVCRRIEAHGEKYPIPNNSKLSSNNLKKFFDYVSKNQINILATPIDKIIQKI